MSDRWVINASPLIVFGKIGQLDLFIRLAEEIVVPQAVADEIAAGHWDKYAPDGVKNQIEGNMLQP